MEVTIPCALYKGGLATYKIVDEIIEQYKKVRPKQREQFSPISRRVFFEHTTNWYNLIFLVPKDETEQFVVLASALLEQLKKEHKVGLFKKIKICPESMRGPTSPSPNAA